MSDIKTKFINDPEQITPELLEGYVLAYPDQVKLRGENIVVRANPKSEDKVAIVTLGGSGHEPALSGFVGEGMLDCSVVGDIFAAPGAQRLFQALQLMKREAGILLVVLNHSGDVMSANMACQLAERVGIKVKQVLTHDDISAGIGADINNRRGLAGCVPHFVEGMDWVKGEYHSVRGLISSEWKREGGKVTLTVTIPSGCTADIRVGDKTETVGSGPHVKTY